MRENISGHVIEYFWEDGKTRGLTEDSVQVLRDAIRQKYVKGKLDQWIDGVLHTCDWYDRNKLFTTEDMFMCGLTDWMRRK